jgi:type II secretory pathway component PulF
VQAALRTGRLGEVLIDVVDHQRTTRDMWRTVRASLAYSGLLLVLACGLGLWVEWGLIGPMAKVYREFELELPAMTQLLIWGHDHGVGALLTGTGLVVGALLVFDRSSRPRQQVRRPSAKMSAAVSCRCFFDSQRHQPRRSSYLLLWPKTTPDPAWLQR